MPTYQTPGVYIEEVASQMKPIEGVATSVAAFIGLATGGPVNTPTKVTSWAQYEREFSDPLLGTFRKDAYMPYAVQGFFLNGGNNAWVIRVGEDAHGGRPFKPLPSATDGIHAFDVVVHPDALERAEAVRRDKSDPKNADFLLEVAVEIDPDEGNPSADPPVAPSVTVKVSSNLPGDRDPAKPKDPPQAPAPEEFDKLTMTPSTHGFVSTVNAASRLIELVPTGGLFDSAELAPAAFKDTLAETAPDAGTPRQLPAETATSQDLKGDELRQTGMQGLVLADEVTMVCVPDLMMLAGNDAQIRDVQTTVASFCERTKRMAILDPPSGLTNQEVSVWRAQSQTPATPFATLYWPWLDILDTKGNVIHIPPCGHVAGVWARTDGMRGVHKAPANEELMGVVGLGFDLDAVAQGELNTAGINCIRGFKGRGTRMWGARTLGADPEYRYLNVRRLVNYISASILQGTQWAVFEPNDEILWGQVSVSVGAFLTGVWRSGALFGATPDQAFFVKCDGDTNPPDLIAVGQVNVHVGVAPVKPAEFVIFQISQFQPPAA
jgi:phage tail sheath protein FI